MDKEIENLKYQRMWAAAAVAGWLIFMGVAYKLAGWGERDVRVASVIWGAMILWLCFISWRLHVKRRRAAAN